jgi:hypothetical protein
MGAIPQSWRNPSSWRSRMLPKLGTPLFGQEQSHHGRSWRTCLSPVSKGFRRSRLLHKLCSSVRKTMKNTSRHMSEGSCDWEHKRPQCPMKSLLRPWSRVSGQDLWLNTSPGNPLRLWRSCFRKWMSTSGPTMISAKQGRKLIGFLRWLGASEGESTLGMSDQSTTLDRVRIEEASFRGHSIAHNLQGSSRALSGHQLQGAGVAGASEEDMGISPGNLLLILWWGQGPHYKNMPGHHSEAKRDCWSWSTAGSAKAGFTYCFVLFSLYTRIRGQSTCSFYCFGHSQASWPQLPLPPPLSPTHTRSQQLEGHQHAQQQRDSREESEARIVNNTVLESKHI